MYRHRSNYRLVRIWTQPVALCTTPPILPKWMKVVDGVHKNILSDYDIFSESRYFIAGEDNTPIHYKNQHILESFLMNMKRIHRKNRQFRNLPGHDSFYYRQYQQ